MQDAITYISESQEQEVLLKKIWFNTTRASPESSYQQTIHITDRRMIVRTAMQTKAETNTNGLKTLKNNIERLLLLYV